MAINLPHELAWVLQMLNYEWPELDEDEIFRAAQFVRQYRDDLDDTVREIDLLVESDLQDSFRTGAVSSYADAWSENRQGNIRTLIDVLGPAADGIELFANAVIAMKTKIIAELVITAAQLAAAAATAFFTAGLSAAANVLLIAARKKALEFITNVAIEQLMAHLLELIMEPLTTRVMQLLTAIMDSPLGQGAAAEVGEFVVDYAAMESIASDMQRNGARHESLGQDFIANISSLQISTAG